MTKTLTQAYNGIIDWNAQFLNKDYQEIDQSIMQPILDLLPEEWDSDLEGHWLEAYLQFCPKCGYLERTMTGNMATYPEQWTESLCKHCGFVLGIVDNSPYMAWYQYKENNFVVEI